MVKRKSEDKEIINTLVKKQKMADKMWPDESTVQAAKKYEKLQEKWLEDSKKNQIREAEEVRKLFSVHPTLNDAKPKEQLLVPPPPRENKPITIAEAKRIDKLQDQLKSEFDTSRRVQVEKVREQEKQQEPIVKAIKEQTENLKTDKKSSNPRVVVRRPIAAVEQFRPRVSSTPGRSKHQDDTLTQVVDPDVFDASTILSPAQNAQELQNRSIREFTENEEIGNIAKQYLSNCNDMSFGVYYDFPNNKLAIGSQTISIENNDIILDRTMDRYVGTEGLWSLLTKAEIHGVQSTVAVGITPKVRLISIGAFTSQDFEKYKNILIKTHALYHNNDPASRRPKASSGWKWKNLISEIWKEMKSKSSSSGSGLLVDTNNPVEYKYIGDYDKLLERIKFIQAEEEAGNNNFNNEKIGIVKFINNEIEKLITQPEGAKHISRCLSALKENDVKGGELMNTTDFKAHANKLGLASDRVKYMQMFSRI